jgi:hypothetical protein
MALTKYSPTNLWRLSSVVSWFLMSDDILAVLVTVLLGLLSCTNAETRYFDGRKVKFHLLKQQIVLTLLV